MNQLPAPRPPVPQWLPWLQHDHRARAERRPGARRLLPSPLGAPILPCDRCALTPTLSAPHLGLAAASAPKAPLPSPKWKPSFQVEVKEHSLSAPFSPNPWDPASLTPMHSLSHHHGDAVRSASCPLLDWQPVRAGLGVVPRLSDPPPIPLGPELLGDGTGALIAGMILLMRKLLTILPHRDCPLTP